MTGQGGGLHHRGWGPGRGLTPCTGSPEPKRPIRGSGKTGRTGERSCGGMGTVGWGPERDRWLSRDRGPGRGRDGAKDTAGAPPAAGESQRRGRAVAAAAPGPPLPHRPAFVCGCGGALPHSGRPMAAAAAGPAAPPAPPPAPPRRRYKAPHRAPRSAAPLTSTASASGCETAPDRPPPW